MKLGLMFLTYSNPIHEHTFLKGKYFDNENCDIVIHPKNSADLNETWRRHMASSTVNITSDTLTTIEAILGMIKNCYDSECDWFCLCSDDSYPFMTCEQLLSILSDQTLSMFPPPLDSLNASKKSKWFLINKTDAEVLLRAYERTDMIRDVFDGTAVKPNEYDEYFFLEMLEKYNQDYSYTKKHVHYIEWFPNVVSPQPIIFNRLINKNSTRIDEYESFFIRKTLETFNAQPIKTKNKALMITIGDKTPINSNYDDFLDKIDDRYDLYIYLLGDDVNKIPKIIRDSCIQIFPIVWNSIEKGYKNASVYFGNSYDSNKIKIIADTDDFSSYNFDAVVEHTISTKNQDVVIDDDKTNEVDEAINKFYQLQQMYNINTKASVKFREKRTAKKNADIREDFLKNFQPKCVNCKQPYGTIFSRKFHESIDENGVESMDVVVFSAKCGNVLNPCALNIDIRKAMRKPYKHVINELKKTLNDEQLQIIKLKNKMLILGNKFKEQYIEQFNKLKTDIQDTSFTLGQYVERNMMLNNNPETEEEIDKLTYLLNQNEINQYKKYIQMYLQSDSINDVEDANLTNAIQLYMNNIVQILDKIRDMKYKVMYVDMDVRGEKNIKRLVQLKNDHESSNFYVGQDIVVKYEEGLTGNPEVSTKKSKPSQGTKGNKKTDLTSTLRTKNKSATGNKTKKKRIEVVRPTIEEEDEIIDENDLYGGSSILPFNPKDIMPIDKNVILDTNPTAILTKKMGKKITVL